MMVQPACPCACRCGSRCEHPCGKGVVGSAIPFDIAVFSSRPLRAFRVEFIDAYRGRAARHAPKDADSFKGSWAVGVPLKEVDRGCGRLGRDGSGLARGDDALRAVPPGLLIHSPHLPMSINLIYAINKRTQPSPKVWKAIEQLQAEVNKRCSWQHESLNLAPVRQPSPAAVAWPFLSSFVPSRPSPAFRREADAPGAPRIADAFAYGSTKVRDNLWSAHLIVAFLKRISQTHPQLLLELRDDGANFVVPGAVWIQNGKVTLQTEWLNGERARALESSGDPNAAAPFVWAESEALSGRFFLEADVSDYAEVPEIRELDLAWDQMRTLRLEDVADIVVDECAATLKEPVAA